MHNLQDWRGLGSVFCCCRARRQGETTQGNNSLKALRVDPKNIFYYKKLLKDAGLIKSDVGFSRCYKLLDFSDAI